MARVFRVDNPSYADLTVQECSSPSAAELLVYRDDSAAAADHVDGVWAFVDHPDLAHLSVYVVPQGRGGAQITISYVKTQALAGWVRPSRFKNRLRCTPKRPAYA
ncbi:MAG: DUF6150 family protein [Pseudomonadota bacterium]